MIALLQTTLAEHLRKEQVFRAVRGDFEKVRINSKNAIALLRRDNVGESQKLIQEAEDILKKLQSDMQKHSYLAQQGMYKEAIEEYAEAKFFMQFMRDESYQFPEFVMMDVEELIGGMCDFTGELVRRAVSLASPEKISELEKYKKITEDIIHELTQVGLQGKLRQKYDEAERNLKRIEGILYDIRIKNMK